MKGNIDRRQAVPDNPLHIPFRHIGERHIIALQKGKPGIVVLKIKRFPHALGHLVNETENAFVPAGPILVHQPVFKKNPQVLVISLFNFQQPLFPGRLFHQNLHIFFLCQILVIKNILYFFAVYAKQPVPRFDFHFLRDTACFHGFHNMSPFLFHPPLLLPFPSYFTRKIAPCHEKFLDSILCQCYKGIVCIGHVRHSYIGGTPKCLTYSKFRTRCPLRL